MFITVDNQLIEREDKSVSELLLILLMLFYFVFVVVVVERFCTARELKNRLRKSAFVMHKATRRFCGVFSGKFGESRPVRDLTQENL